MIIDIFDEWVSSTMLAYWCLEIIADLQVALTVKKASDHTPYLQKVALGAQNHLQQKKWQQMNICLITAAAKPSTIIVGE